MYHLKDFFKFYVISLIHRMGEKKGGGCHDVGVPETGCESELLGVVGVWWCLLRI